MKSRRPIKLKIVMLLSSLRILFFLSNYSKLNYLTRDTGPLGLFDYDH